MKLYNRRSILNIFQESITAIKKEYNSNPNELGWRFLTTSKNTLKDNNGIFLITLNPGGNQERDDHSVESCENGCAYLVENWENKKEPGTSTLQKQFQLLFQEISKEINIHNYISLLESSVCGYFIPFRSPSFKDLKEKERCIKFSKDLWKNILQECQFKVLLSIDKITYKYLNEILIEFNYKLISEFELDTGWGNYKCSISKYNNGDGTISVTRFPHLSRFTIFGRNNSKKYIENIIHEIFNDYNK